MTPMEAWSIVAPILAAHSTNVHQHGQYTALNAIDEAYVIVFGALKQLEEQQKEGSE